jgi:hypothetical protein
MAVKSVENGNRRLIHKLEVSEQLMSTVYEEAVVKSFGVQLVFRTRCPSNMNSHL